MARCRKTDGLDTNRPTNRMTGKMPIPHQARQAGWKPTCKQAGSLHVDRQTGWKPIPLFGGGSLQMGIFNREKTTVLRTRGQDSRHSSIGRRGQKRQSNELHGNEESLEKPRGKSVSPENSKALLMEAAGIEPASRDTSDRASTCLADSYLSRPLRSLLASVQCASLELF